MDSYGATYWALAFAIAGREQRAPEIHVRRPWVHFQPPHPNGKDFHGTRVQKFSREGFVPAPDCKSVLDGCACVRVS